MRFEKMQTAIHRVLHEFQPFFKNLSRMWPGLFRSCCVKPPQLKKKLVIVQEVVTGELWTVSFQGHVREHMISREKGSDRKDLHYILYGRTARIRKKHLNRVLRSADMKGLKRPCIMQKKL